MRQDELKEGLKVVCPRGITGYVMIDADYSMHPGVVRVVCIDGRVRVYAVRDIKPLVVPGDLKDAKILELEAKVARLEAKLGL